MRLLSVLARNQSARVTAGLAHHPPRQQSRGCCKASVQGQVRGFAVDQKLPHHSLRALSCRPRTLPCPLASQIWLAGPILQTQGAQEQFRAQANVVPSTVLQDQSGVNS